MNPGDRPSIPLASEPFLFLHPRGIGQVAPLAVQPAPGPFGLEEEPALWPLATGPTPAGSPPGRRGRAAVASRPSGPRLAATGLPAVPIVGAALLGLAAVLRRRRPG